MEKKVLVVDDDDRVVQSIAGVLEDEGFQVITAKSGEEAIEIFEQKKPDVTLLDIWMPGMDGIEVLKRLKRMVPDCQAIMISGHATISTAMTAVKLGAFDFIEKPLSLDVLLMTIRRALDRQKQKGDASPGELLSRGLPSPSFSNGVLSSDEASRGKGASYLLQRTLKRSMVLYGTGLHSGKKTGLLLQPLPPNSGILFGNVSSDDAVPAHLDYVQATDFATSGALRALPPVRGDRAYTSPAADRAPDRPNNTEGPRHGGNRYRGGSQGERRARLALRV